MGKVFSSLFGSSGENKQARLQIASQQQQIQSDTGRQLATLSKTQAQNDLETATLNKPGLGRALLQYQDKNTGAGASTLGG